MELNTYQKFAKEYDQNPNNKMLNSHIIPFFGLVGESGALVSEFKKRLRDKQAHIKFKDNVEEILGNILWYASNIASKLDLELENIATRNLKKIRERFPKSGSIICTTELFDNNYPEKEQIPRALIVEFKPKKERNKTKILIFVNGKQVGNELTDNAYEDDGYRFHDIFHFSYAAILGWSPVVRSIMACKRKSNMLIDEVEDGARAAIIEEAISAFIYQQAKDHMFYDRIEKVDHFILKTIKSLVSHLEVTKCTIAEWERAILMGYSVFRELINHNGGKVLVSLENREITYIDI